MPPAPVELPDGRRLAAIRRRLHAHYGTATPKPHRDPVGELVLTILSQNTNDRNRDVAYTRIGERWQSWEAVRAAPVEEIERAIQPGGISNLKSERIKQVLERLASDPLPDGADPDGRWQRQGEIDLDWLEHSSLEIGRDYLCTLPGVARKTAACVLLFAYGLQDVPVDTHVGRVGTRLGLFPEKASFETMHDMITAWTPDGQAHPEHVNLLRHGRRLCHKRLPECSVCPLADICPRVGVTDSV